MNIGDYGIPSYMARPKIPSNIKNSFSWENIAPHLFSFCVLEVEEKQNEKFETKSIILKTERIFMIFLPVEWTNAQEN